MSAHGQHPSEAGTKTAAFRFLISDTSLAGQTIVIDDPIPTGRQILEAGGRRPADDFVLLQIGDGRVTRVIGPDDTVDLRHGDKHEFVAGVGDRLFLFEIDGRRMAWLEPGIAARAVKLLAGAEVDEFDVLVERQDEPDRVLGDDEVLALSDGGIENVRLRRRVRQVVIIVNTKYRVTVAAGRHTGLEIKQAAIAQGVPIQLDFLLSLERPGHPSQMIGDHDEVDVREHMAFTAIADDDNS